ncbi:MAG: triose-phosphate isomerase [Thermodesulfobacteria bacterium]|nr:triose-phosphate isomerase [Thermodesulfobacteriota bacterium]
MTKRRPLMAANWKMHKTVSEMEDYLQRFLPLVSDVTDRDIVLAPSFVCLMKMAEILAGSNVDACAQNMFHEEQGAYTGEVSPLMLRDVGVKRVILGHSERRHIFQEDGQTINKKVLSAVRHGLSPIYCIGETLDERESGKTSEVLKSQVEEGLKGLSKDDFSMVAVAYEPVWAIGTGKTASTDQIQEAHALVRQEISQLAGEDIAQNLRILYGGSVKPDNVGQIMALDDVDGALVGGASLVPESFTKIVRFEID